MAATPTILLVVLTGGSVRIEQKLVPTSAGMMRLETAAQFLTENPTAKLAISGGWRDDPDQSEARVYHRHFVNEWPMLADRVVIVDASGKYTAADMVALAARIREAEVLNQQRFDDVWFVTHPDHAALAMISFRASLPFGSQQPLKTLPSGEPAPYGNRTLAMLNWATKHDPRWRTWLTLPLRWLANRRGRNE